MLKHLLLGLSGVFFVSCGLHAQTDTLGRVTHSAGFTFVLRDGTCLFGSIVSSDSTRVTMKNSQQLIVPIERTNLSQVSQGDALIYSARSSWLDVSNAHPYTREAILLTLANGTHIKGQMVNVDPNGILLRHGFRQTEYKKSNIATVDYLRLKPETSDFDFLLEEAPWVLLFNPEFYSRTAGLEGRIPVRLYDASKPEDNSANCLTTHKRPTRP